MAIEKGIVMLVKAMLLCLLFQGHTCNAKTWLVGDDEGWTFNVDNWPNGKSFTNGDILVFKYDPSRHNVVQVDSSGYEGCNSSGPVFNSGNDQLILVQGNNYFICGIPGHCSNGQKIAINAA